MRSKEHAETKRQRQAPADPVITLNINGLNETTPTQRLTINLKRI